ncbi:MAG: hypothetical protein LBR34_08985 [Prevotella sp.]|jgi:hypothetical protein|nr:hypothetical protein [Prevotella sp.]
MENKPEQPILNRSEQETDEHFVKIRDEMRQFLAERNLFPQIARQLSLSINTVRRTFELSASEKDLKGNRWQVWNAAIDLIYNIKTLASRAESVLKM